MSDITQSTMEKALQYLGESEEEYASAISRAKAADHRLKISYATAYLEVDGKNVEERKARALLTDTHKFAVDEYENSIYDKEIVSAKRKRAETTIDCWRSINSSRNRGHVV